MTHGRDAEPFARTTRPGVYIARPETERVLERLQAWVRSGDTASIQLTAAAGMGKSLLLHVLAERTAGAPASVRVPYPNLMPDDLASWVLDALGEQRERDPQAQLLEVAQQHSAAGGLLLLIDDAERLPPETRDALDHWFHRSAGSLRSVRATARDSAAGDTDASTGEAPTLTQELDLEESIALLEAAMDRAGLHGPRRARFNRAVMLQLHDRSRGVPARLLVEAARLHAEWYAAAGPAPPSPSGEPARAPTQRALAQLELALAAESATPGARRAEPQSERSPAREPAPLLDLPPEPPPPPRGPSAARSRGAMPWIAGASAGAVLVAVALTLLPEAPDGDAASVAVSELSPVAAAPLPAPPTKVPTEAPSAAAMPTADPGVGSIELLETAPPAPEPQPETSAPEMLAAAPDPPRTPAARGAPADAGRVVVEGVIQKGEWLAASFRRRGIPGELAALIAREMGGAYDFRRSQPGDRYRVTRNREGELVAFDYEVAAEDVLELRLAAGRYTLRRSAAVSEPRRTPRN